MTEKVFAELLREVWDRRPGVLLKEGLLASDSSRVL
jgi:hypothetical protein